MKCILHSFWRAIIWWENNNLMQIASTSSKLIILAAHIWTTASSMYYIWNTCNKKQPTKITKTKTWFWFSTIFIVQNWCKIYKIIIFWIKIRGRARNHTPSGMEFLMTLVNSWKPLTYAGKNSPLDVVASLICLCQTL